MDIRMMAERTAATNNYPGADWGKLLRDAIPGIFQEKWKEVDIPIKVDGVARENKVGPCKGYHYVLGHQVEIEEFRLTWTTWTLEHKEIKFDSCYDFEIHGEELVLMDGELNLFAGGIIKDPYGNAAYELLTALGETKKLFK